ncbi:hypothetical protein Tco_1099897, partial [Tanacetum coccineum]
MSSSSIVTYTSVYTDSEPGRVFWGADEELSDGGSPRVIVYGYDGLPMQTVAPPSLDYVPRPEHPPSPDYVPDPEYPHSPVEVPYVPVGPLPANASLTALSPGYVADSDSKEDPEEDPEEDHADYPTDGGDDDDESSDDDDDDTDDEDEEPFEEEDDDEEEEEHLPPTDPSAVPVTRTTARISIRPKAPMPFPSEEEVERLLALPPPPPSPLISLSPPSVEERLARCLAALALPSSPLPIVPYLYGSPNHVRAPPGFRDAIGRLRASSPSTPLPPPPSSLHLPPPVPTSLPLPSSPLPPLPASLFIPPPVDHREDTPEAELPPHKRLCLTALALRYKVGESSTTSLRPAGGHRIDYGFFGTLDAETRRLRVEEVGYKIRDAWVDLTESVEEVAPTTLEGVNARVTELAAVQEVNGLVKDGQFHYETAQLLDQEALVSREAWAYSIRLSSAVHYELQAYRNHTQMQDFRIALQESLVTTLNAHVSSLQGQLSAALGQIQALQARGQTHADDREGKFPSVFSLEIHHGGKLSESPNRLYDGREVNWFDQIDSDGFSVVEVNQMLKCLGYLNPKMEYWYKMPNKDALLSLSNDNEVLRFIKYVDRYKLMQLYVVHPVDKPKPLGDNEVSDETFDPLFYDLDPETSEVPSEVPNVTEPSEFPNVTEPSEVPNVTEPSEVPNGSEPSEIPDDVEHSDGSDESEDIDDSDFDVELEDMIKDVEVDMDDFRKYTDENVEWVGRNEVPVEDTQPVDTEVFEDVDLEDFDSASDPDDIECNRKKALRMLAKKHKPVDGNIYSENFYCGQTFANKELIKKMVSRLAVENRSRSHFSGRPHCDV